MDKSQISDLFALAASAGATYRANVTQRAVPAQMSADEAADIFGGPLPQAPSDPEQLIKSIIAQADTGLLQATSPNFYGYVIGGSHPAGVAADFLVSAWGNFSSFADETPATVAMENALVQWCLQMFGLPQSCGAGVATGATQANAICLMAARNQLLKDRGWDVEAGGLFGAPVIPVIIGEQAHSAAFAALRYVGFGAKRVITIPADDQGRMLPEPLEAELSKLDVPALIVAQSGSINSGDSDPFDQIADAVERTQKEQGNHWIHVDGAFGLWLAASPQLRSHVQGIERADSWAVDLHKWLNAPYDGALAIVKNRAPLVAAMSAKGSYLPDANEHFDPSDTVMELSRRARGVPAYAIVRALGHQGIIEMIERHCALAQYAAEQLEKEPGVTVLNEVVANQVGITLGEGEAGDKQTQEVLEMVHRRGKVFPSHGHWKGRQTIRISVSNYLTQKENIDLLVDEIVTCWRQVQTS